MSIPTVTPLQKKKTSIQHCFHSALIPDIITTKSYDEHKLQRSWFPIYDFLYSWVEFLQNKTIYHTCSPNIINIPLFFFFLPWKGRGQTTHLWNKLLNPHHALLLGQDAHKKSIIHCINSGWKLPSITSILISITLCMSYWFNLFWWSLFYCTQFSITGKFWLHYPQFWCFKIVEEYLCVFYDSWLFIYTAVQTSYLHMWILLVSLFYMQVTYFVIFINYQTFFQSLMQWPELSLFITFKVHFIEIIGIKGRTK